METGNALVLIAAVIAAAIVLQAFAVIVFLMSFKRSFARLENTIVDFLAEMRPVLKTANEFLTESRERVATITAKIDSITANAVEISGIVRHQAQRLDGMLTDASDQARLQLIRLDQMMQGAFSRIEDTGELVRRSIVTPVKEMSALVFGLRTSLDFLFKRSKARRAPVTQDEELFI